MYNKATQAYGKTSRDTIPPRELEASILIKAAAKLQTVRDELEKTRDGLNDALLYNRRLWTIFVDAASAEDTPLPEDIKNNIINLGLFVFSQSLDVQIKPTAEKLTTLISINREVAAGLRDRGVIPE